MTVCNKFLVESIFEIFHETYSAPSNSINRFNLNNKANWPEFSKAPVEQNSSDPCELNSSIRDTILWAADKHIPKTTNQCSKPKTLPQNYIIEKIYYRHLIRRQVT